MRPFAAAAAGANAVPHEEQNRAPASTVAPQLGQLKARELPHEAQKRAPSALELPQLGHVGAMAVDCMDCQVGPAASSNRAVVRKGSTLKATPQARTRHSTELISIGSVMPLRVTERGSLTW